MPAVKPQRYLKCIIAHERLEEFFFSTSASTSTSHLLELSTSSPSSQGFRASTNVDSRWSPQRAPTVTQTCFCGAFALIVSRNPVHRSRDSLLNWLFPSPPFVTHSLTTSLMKLILRRKSFAAGMPWSSGSISGRRRVVAVRPGRAADDLAWKFRRVCRGYDSIDRSSSAAAPIVPVVASLSAASCGRCQKWHQVPVASRTILV